MTDDVRLQTKSYGIHRLAPRLPSAAGRRGCETAGILFAGIRVRRTGDPEAFYVPSPFRAGEKGFDI